MVLRREVNGVWRPVTAAEFAHEVTAVAKGLIAAGLEPGGRVAVMSRTRYEWTVLDFAIWAAGGQTVPVYATSSADQVEWIVRDSGARHVVTETAANTATVLAGTADHPEGPRAWELDADALADLTALGRGVSDEEVTKRRTALTPDTVATLCYTSGTTGRPKGCVLTHANLHAEAANTVELLHPIFKEVTGQTASTLLFPAPRPHPRPHHPDRLSAGPHRDRPLPEHQARRAAPRAEDVPPDLPGRRPVPLREDPRHGPRDRREDRRGASFDRAHHLAVRFGVAHLERFLGRGKGPGPALWAGWALYDLLVYRRVRAELGGRMRYAISGGSPLDHDLNLFFYAAGIMVYEGYGLTETTAAATVIPPLGPRPGTVGPPIPGTSVRIADDGEVLIKGGIVFGAYRNNPEATAAALTDGWFATGDLGCLDADGYLTITGRKKDLLVTSGGSERLPGRPGGPPAQPPARRPVPRRRRQPPLRRRPGHPRPGRRRPLAVGPGGCPPTPRCPRSYGTSGSTPRSRRPSTTPTRPSPGPSRSAPSGSSRASSPRRTGCWTPSLKVKRHAAVAAYADEIEALYAAPGS